ncbi:hypothetical protein RhiirA5_427680 [Rhizophagus irregularis]|uniref:F-box domain-containing protein n=2 Tax=Rhizophagus irregularis TaxID=588596 RepID=A0A2I1FAE6_9GLOM|nr:hypothetical protein RhiirA5_427680 [Rhizophagus irregularis]PKC59755.1 hypothetical protein RhiirA1_468984 [Rhizophagus irregularis]PKY31340.1 hypothetical protein RhiirB3_448898 [Rhizophagus irregularis]
MNRLNFDILTLIFVELRKDHKSLHSFLLVNRVWCRLVVPILWRKCLYTYIDIKSSKKLSNVILSYLSSSSKQLLLDNNIMLPSTIFSKPLTFNYISFCKYMNNFIIYNIIDTVFIPDIEKIKKRNHLNLLKREVCKLFVSQCKNIKKLSWKTFQTLSSFPGAQTCFSQLYSLIIDMNFVNSDSLYEMSQICKDLNQLTICGCSRDIPGLISLIDAQKKLKIVSIIFNTEIEKKMDCEELSRVLAKKGSTINNLTLCSSVGYISHSFLTSLVNLKSLYIYHNYDYDDYKEVMEFQQYNLINVNFPYLQYLIIEGLTCFKECAILVEKTKGNILSVDVNTIEIPPMNTGMLIKVIANNCPKIEKLSTYFEFEDLIYAKLLLVNCSNLTYLTFKSLNENYNIGDELVEILIKFSPKSLTKITLKGNWKYSIDVFDRFLESCVRRNYIVDAIDKVRNLITIGYAEFFREYKDEEVVENSNIT